MFVERIISNFPEQQQLEIKTQRDQIEQLLLQYFPESIHRVDNQNYQRINRVKNGHFARSMLGIMLYANGYNLRGTSTHNPNGLIYDDGKHFFGIGIFKRTLSSKSSHLMVVAPIGEDVHKLVEAFLSKIDILLEEHKATDLLAESYVRHIELDQYQQYIDMNYVPVIEAPWDEEAPAEDEEKNHKLIKLTDMIELDADGDGYTVKTLQGQNSRSFRTKAKMANNRFENFLTRCDYQLKIIDYNLKYQDIAEKLVIRHFGSLKNPVGSTPEDYFNIVRYQPPENCQQYFAKIGFLQPTSQNAIDLDEGSIPIMLFIGEKVAADKVAFYATFALRDTDVLPSHIDTRGYSAISQYCYLQLFNMLMKQGVEWVNVGGSETDDLDKFKRQLGATLEDSYWAVRLKQST